MDKQIFKLQGESKEISYRDKICMWKVEVLLTKYKTMNVDNTAQREHASQRSEDSRIKPDIQREAYPVKISERLESWRESSTTKEEGRSRKKGVTSTKCAEQLKREQIKT